MSAAPADLVRPCASSATAARRWRQPRLSRRALHRHLWRVTRPALDARGVPAHGRARARARQPAQGDAGQARWRAGVGSDSLHEGLGELSRGSRRPRRLSGAGRPAVRSIDRASAGFVVSDDSGPTIIRCQRDRLHAGVRCRRPCSGDLDRELSAAAGRDRVHADCRRGSRLSCRAVRGAVRCGAPRRIRHTDDDGVTCDPSSASSGRAACSRDVRRPVSAACA